MKEEQDEKKKKGLSKKTVKLLIFGGIAVLVIGGIVYRLKTSKGKTKLINEGKPLDYYYRQSGKYKLAPLTMDTGVGTLNLSNLENIQTETVFSLDYIKDVKPLGDATIEGGDVINVESGKTTKVNLTTKVVSLARLLCGAEFVKTSFEVRGL